MEEDGRRFVLTDEPAEDGERQASVRGKRYRRCVGCAKCLTETPGRCVLDDGFPEISDRIMGCDVLEIHMEARDGRIAPTMSKLIERLSNELQAFTRLGGNVPLDASGARLRTIEAVVGGDPGDRTAFEKDIEDSLRMGPVGSVSVRYD